MQPWLEIIGYTFAGAGIFLVGWSILYFLVQLGKEILKLAHNIINRINGMLIKMVVWVYRDFDLDDKDGIMIPIIGLPLGASMCGIGYLLLK